MKLDGFGPPPAMSAASRFDMMKIGGEAKASVGSERAAEKSALPVSSSSMKSSSKEAEKNFSRILKETEKSYERDETSSSADADSASVASNVATLQSKPISPTDSRSEKPGVTTESKISINPRDESATAQAEPSIVTQAPGTSVDEKISEIVETLEQTAETELSMRHLSMREFLGKMKTEFGIEPQQIVKAFANLDPSALQASPDQTADAVLAQLGLMPEQLPKAEAFYREMLIQTGESALTETMAGVGAGVTLKVLSEQDLAMDKLQKSILSLNDAFARRGELGPGSSVVAASLAQTSTPTSVDSAELGFKTDADIAIEKENKSTSKLASLGAALSAASAELAASSGATSSGGSNGSGSGSENPKSDTSGSEITKSKEFGSIESALAASGFSTLSGAEKSATPLMAGTSTAAALAATIANPEGDGSAANAQNLVRNAQILMKNGGGEMKMQLKPEGVGEVTLKVAVKDGQVAIQMMTENDSAKKILESNLDDLKTSLAQHKLHVDALKIEVGTDLAKQRFEQSQQDHNRDQARQMAQDFMGQFREDRQGFRQGFFDQSGFKNYRQPNRNPLPTIEPVVTTNESQQKSAGERRLNLVA